MSEHASGIGAAREYYAERADEEAEAGHKQSFRAPLEEALALDAERLQLLELRLAAAQESGDGLRAYAPLLLHEFASIVRGPTLKADLACSVLADLSRRAVLETLSAQDLREVWSDVLARTGEANIFFIPPAPQLAYSHVQCARERRRSDILDAAAALGRRPCRGPEFLAHRARPTLDRRFLLPACPAGYRASRLGAAVAVGDLGLHRREAEARGLAHPRTVAVENAVALVRRRLGLGTRGTSLRALSVVTRSSSANASLALIRHLVETGTVPQCATSFLQSIWRELPDDEDAANALAQGSVDAFFPNSCLREPGAGAKRAAVLWNERNFHRPAVLGTLDRLGLSRRGRLVVIVAEASAWVPYQQLPLGHSVVWNAEKLEQELDGLGVPERPRGDGPEPDRAVVFDVARRNLDDLSRLSRDQWTQLFPLSGLEPTAVSKTADGSMLFLFLGSTSSRSPVIGTEDSSGPDDEASRAVADGAPDFRPAAHTAVLRASRARLPTSQETSTECVVVPAAAVDRGRCAA